MKGLPLIYRVSLFSGLYCMLENHHPFKLHDHAAVSGTRYRIPGLNVLAALVIFVYETLFCPGF